MTVIDGVAYSTDIMNVLLSKFTRGFTIVELIVIIVVIGILASIAIVSYSGSQNRANKSSLESTAQQVKLKLGEHFTDKNVYPVAKADVVTYLNAINSSTLANSFNATYNATQINYFACTEGTTNCTATNCNATTSPCKTYKIVIPKSAWRGNTADVDLEVKP